MMEFRDARQRTDVLTVLRGDDAELGNAAPQVGDAAPQIGNVPRQQFHGLGQRLMPFGEAFQAFVNRHLVSLAPGWRITLL
jgi:hypothetical protein